MSMITVDQLNIARDELLHRGDRRWKTQIFVTVPLEGRSESGPDSLAEELVKWERRIVIVDGQERVRWECMETIIERDT